MFITVVRPVLRLYSEQFTEGLSYRCSSLVSLSEGLGASTASAEEVLTNVSDACVFGFQGSGGSLKQVPLLITPQTGLENDIFFENSPKNFIIKK